MNVRKTAPKLAIGQLVVWKAGALSHEKMDQAKKPLAQQGRLLASRICWQLSLSTRTIMPQRSSLGDLSDAEPAAPHGFIVVLRLVPNVGRPRTEEDCGVTPSPSSRLLYVAKTWKKLKGFGQNFQSLSDTCSEAANLPTCGGAPA